MAKGSDLAAGRNNGAEAAEAAQRAAEEAARLARIQAEIEAERRHQAEVKRQQEAQARKAEAEKAAAEKLAHKDAPAKEQTNGTTANAQATKDLGSSENKTIAVDATHLYPVKTNQSNIDLVKSEVTKPEAHKAEKPSDELINATAKKLREDLHVDKWATDLRGGDAKKAETTLSSLPRDKETMGRLEKAYASDRDREGANLTKDIEERLSKPDAARLKATIENPQSDFARLDTASSRLADAEQKRNGQEKIKPLVEFAALISPSTKIGSEYFAAETNKELSAGRRELREQLSVMNSSDIEVANRESMAKNGKPLEQSLLETPGLREEDKKAIQIMLKGSDQRALNPELSLQVAELALQAKDVDMLREGLSSSPEAREMFRQEGKIEKLTDSFSGKDLKVANDIATTGEIQASTLVEFNQGIFGTSKEGASQAIKTMSEEQREALRRGHELSQGNTSSANASASDKQAVLTYQNFEKTLKESFNSRDAGDLAAQAIYGDKNLISQLAQTQSDGLVGIGAGHDKVKVLDLVDRQLSSEDYERLKGEKGFSQDLNANLKTFLNQDEFDRVNEILDKKIATSSFEQSQSVGRTTSERLKDLVDGGISDEDRGTAIKDVLTMSAAERGRYKEDANYRIELDKQVNETLGQDTESAKITRRLLSEASEGKEPKLNALETVQVGGLNNDSLPKTIENIENCLKVDPTALNRIKTPISQEDANLKRTLENELQQAVNRSGKVYYDENGGSNFDLIYKPLAKNLFEENGQVDITSKLIHTDRDLEAFKALTKVSDEEKAVLLKKEPQSEQDKTLQQQVFGKFASQEEKQLAQEILTKGEFTPLMQLRAAAVTTQSLNSQEIDNVKSTLGQVKPEDRAALNDVYAKQYKESLTEIVNKIPKEEQASVTALLQGERQNRAEQVETLSHERRESESGLLGNVDFGDRYTSAQSAGTYLKAQETASAKFEELPVEKQQALFTQASENYSKWQEVKKEKAEQITDGVIIGGSLLLTAGASAPTILGAAALGGTVKTLGNKALIGDSYGNVEEIATDFTRGSLNTLLNAVGPAQAARTLNLGNAISREASEAVVTKLGQEGLEVGSGKLLKEGSQSVLEKDLRHAVQTSIADGSDTVSHNSIKNLAAKVATDGNQEVVEKAITDSLTNSSDALAKRTILQKAATEQGLNVSSAYAGGAGSGMIEGLANWDPALSADDNVKRTAKSAHETGVMSGAMGLGLGGLGAGAREVLHKVGSDSSKPITNVVEGNLKESNLVDGNLAVNELRLARSGAEQSALGEKGFFARLFGGGAANKNSAEVAKPDLLTDMRVRIDGQDVLQNKGSLTIGRGMLGSVEDTKVSRNHGNLKWNEEEGSFYFTDNSTNGSYRKNGNKFERLPKGESVKLNSSDEIRLGSEEGPKLSLLNLNKAKEHVTERQIIINGEVANFEGGKIEVGRAHQYFNQKDNVDRMVSGNHGTLAIDQSGRYLYADHSGNGSYIKHKDGQTERLHNKSIVLESGDEIRLGFKDGPLIKINEMKSGKLSDGATLYRQADGDLIVNQDGSKVFEDRAGSRVSFNDKGQVAETASVHGLSSKFEYAENGELVSAKYSDGSEYNRGQHTIKHPDGSESNGFSNTWEHKQNGELISSFAGKIRTEQDGALRIENPDGKVTLKRADGLEELHWPGHQIAYKNADLAIETEKLEALAKHSFAEKPRAERLETLMREVEARNLPKAEIAETYRQVNRLLSASDTAKVGQEERASLAEQILYGAARPREIDQGNNSTCNVTTLETRAFERNPSAAARLIADVALTGKYVTPQGTIIDIERVGGIIPDKEARKVLDKPFSTNSFADIKNDGSRTFAGQIFQNTAVNIHFAEKSAGHLFQGTDYRYQPGDVVQYRKVNLVPGTHGTGEQLVAFRPTENNSFEEIFIDDSPHLGANSFEGIYGRITPAEGYQGRPVNGSETGFVIAGPGTGYDRSHGVTMARSQQELETTLLKAQREDKLPVVLFVDARDPLFEGSGAEGGSGGGHVITVESAYQVIGKDGKPHLKVEFCNQWGKKWNRLGDNAVDAEDLFRATRMRDENGKLPEDPLRLLLDTIKFAD